MREWTAPIDRLIPKLVEDSSGCWLFTGARHSEGYGVIARGGHGNGMLYAHRVTFEFFICEIPTDLHLDHLCRVRHCCNPWHLEPVTCRVNLIRGDGPTGRAARATECPQGHPYDEANTAYQTDGSRRCKACNRNRQRALRAARRSAAA